MSRKARGNRIRRIRRSVISHIFSLNSHDVGAVVACHDSVMSVSVSVGGGRLCSVMYRRLCRICPMARKGALSGVVKMICLGSLFKGLGDYRFGLHSIVHPTRCFRRGVSMCGMLRRVHRRGVGCKLVYSRFNDLRNVVAVGSVLRTLMNALPDSSRSPSVIPHGSKD